MVLQCLALAFLTLCVQTGCITGTTDGIQEARQYLLLAGKYNWYKARHSCGTFGHSLPSIRPTEDLHHLKVAVKKFYESGNLTTDIWVGRCNIQGLIYQSTKWCLLHSNFCGDIEFDNHDEDECLALTKDEQCLQFRDCYDALHVVCLRNSTMLSKVASETSMAAAGTSGITDTSTTDITPTPSLVQSSVTTSTAVASTASATFAMSAVATITASDTSASVPTTATARNIKPTPATIQMTRSDTAATPTTTAATSTTTAMAMSDIITATVTDDSRDCGCCIGTGKKSSPDTSTQSPGRNRVEKKTLSSYRRSKTSIMEVRPSAVGFGVMGVGVLASVTLFIMSGDVISMWVWLMHCKK